jgi:hypothetical protein
MPQLSDRHTLLLPVHLQGLEAELRLDAVRMVPKKEHHLTVFGFAAGKVIARVLAAEPGLRDRINGLAGSFDWAVALQPQFVHLARPEPAARPGQGSGRKDKGGGMLQTVIVRANARLPEFYEEVSRFLVSQDGPSGELRALLAQPPPPHVTLYTTDPEGLAGIGLNTVRELDEALERGAAGDVSRLAAYVLAPGVLSVPTMVRREAQ